MSDGAVTDLTRGVYRRLYGGFVTGQRINKLSLNAEAWFWRVLVSVDDFGNGRADPELCRAATAGNRRVTAKQVSDWLREMQSVGLVQFYTVKGEPLLHVVGFESTQPAGKNGRRIRRFACPDESEAIQDFPDAVSASDSDNTNDPYSDSEQVDSPPFSGGEFLATLSNFEQHRREIKKPLKPTGRKLLYGQLQEMGEVKAVAAMKTSMANGWQGIFEPNSSSQRRSKTEITMDNVKRVVAEYEH